MYAKKTMTLEDIGSFLEKLADKSESVYWLSSPDFTKIQYISPAYEKIWGRKRDIMYREPERWITYLHPDDAKNHHPIKAMADRVAQEGPLARYQENYRIIRPNGEVRWIFDQGFPIYDDQGQCCGVSGIAVDITKEKLGEELLRQEKEKAETANKAKTEFLENMRHDIRTPLMGITGFAEMIKHEATDEKIKNYADNLITSSNSLLDLLNGVLEAIKVGSGEIPLLKKKFNLQQKLNEVLLLNHARASQKNIQLLFDYDSTIPAYLMGDSTRIHRIVLELVTNALNFTHKGQVKLSAQLAKATETEVILKIMVEDTGIGIPFEKQQEIYVQFKRLTPSSQGIYRGFGLGLSLVKQLVDDLKGEIYVESQQDAGSRFFFILKLKKPLLEESLGSEACSPFREEIKDIPSSENKKIATTLNSISASYKITILVVEDSDFAASIITNLLSRLHCNVDRVENGKEAVQLAKKNRYDLIFMDIGLPDIDGYETTKRIRLNELQEKRVPIIALTAHIDEENKKFGLNVGMNDMLNKPLTTEKAEIILNTFVPHRKDAVVLSTPFLGEEETLSENLDLFDREALNKRFGGEAGAATMMALLRESLPQEKAKLQRAYQEKDWVSLQTFAHTLKGDISFYGASQLHEACFNLETSIKLGKSEVWEEVYYKLLIEITLLEKALL